MWGTLLIVGGFATAFIVSRALTSPSSSTAKRSSRSAVVRQEFDAETGCPIKPTERTPMLPMIPFHSTPVTVTASAFSGPTASPLSDEDDLAPITERMERDPVLRAMVLGSGGDATEVIAGIEALRSYTRTIRQDHACLDPHGYLRNGEGRLLEFRLIVDDDERDPSVEVVVDSEVMGDAAVADDADDIKRCLDSLFLGTHPPRRNGTGVGIIVVRWVLTGDGIKNARLVVPPGARLPQL